MNIQNEKRNDIVRKKALKYSISTMDEIDKIYEE